MPQREFANQKVLIDYAEQNGLVYVWGWIIGSHPGHRSAQGSNLRDLSTRWRPAVRAISLRQIWFAVLWSTVEAGSFLLTVFDDFGTDEWRKMLRSQHAVDQLHGQPIILMASL
jgi:hypothetical protein